MSKHLFCFVVVYFEMNPVFLVCNTVDYSRFFLAGFERKCVKNMISGKFRCVSEIDFRRKSCLRYILYKLGSSFDKSIKGAIPIISQPL